jgi:uncharacterized protein (TIGR02271 family)
MIDQNTVASLSGATVRDTAGDKLGKVSQVYLDDQTGQPEWVTVRTGLFGGKDSFVPLAAADLQGDELVVNTDKDTVSGAPQIDGDEHLSEQDEAELYRYYGLDRTDAGKGDDRTGYAVGGIQDSHAGRTDQNVGRDTSGPRTDDAMTRSEERLRAGTEQVETGRARLRKHVVTETQQVEVPVSHEEVTLEREPITDGNRDAATSGADISEEEHEVTLRAQRPVVTTETEAVERVRLGKETVTGTETVSGEVRKEEIELDDQTGTARDDASRR